MNSLADIPCALENNSTMHIYGRTLVDWQGFVPKAIPIAKTSLKKKSSEDVGDSEEESSEEEDDDAPSKPAAGV